ncbi:Diguanylate kinase [Legionella donaldsonii]|uniref:diguanylate cyclase n=1 Tax=Legionella donaldsonii TaxID=45060 RepID=A0A378J2T7_9GAMM|nr:diguanylate cyclase [Legionella donaldsonii]STX41706.1 Diguanylate kinase [Legionella donaldsonii]
MLSANMIPRHELQQVIIQLEQALSEHLQWHSTLLRALVCHLPIDNNNLQADGHHQCIFGQWLSTSAPKELNDYPGFLTIDEAHKKIHLLALQLVKEAATGTISPVNYDLFTSALAYLQLEITALKSELESLLYNRDALTGAISQLGILPILREQQELAKRQGQNCCIAMVDLDHFSEINEQHGRYIGDKVLAAIAHYLIDNLRPYDRVFRYGGEEFLLCIPFTALAPGQKVVERLRKGLATITIDAGQQETIRMTVSIGLALLDPHLPIEQCIDHSMHAMSAAKAAGRNCVQIWETSNE